MELAKDAQILIELCDGLPFQLCGDDSSDYDSVVDELSILQLPQQPSNKSLLQHMFCLPLN